MSFAIKYRRIDHDDEPAPETLAVDIENRADARALVDRLAGSYAQNGRHRPPMRWFRDRAGLHLIWAQRQ